MPPTATALRRIAHDIKTLRDPQFADTGIFWIGDETNLAHGWAVVCGCADTPYHGGAFCFDVTFPDTYPFAPPSFTFITQDGKTRFNPNLYTTGKVCLSLLNTWAGERWSAVQSLGSVLQCIQSAVLNEQPLVNEPAHPASSNAANPEIAVYNRLVFHATLKTVILEQLATPPTHLVPVLTAVQAWFVRAAPALVKRTQALAAEWDGKTETMSAYGMGHVLYTFEELGDKVALLAAELSSLGVGG